MTRALRLVVLALALGGAMGARAELPRPVARAFLDAGIRLDRVAVVVQDVSRARPLFAYDADRPMSPASVMKLVTTFAALELLGPDYRWRTEAFLDGRLEGGVLHGNLVLKGHGDPKITVEQWQSFMAKLRASGLDAITGDLVLDRSAFDVPPYDPGAFDGEPRKPYNVGPDALLVNFKAVHLTLAADPAARAAQVLVDPPLDAVQIAQPPLLDAAPCDDWLASTRPRIADDGTLARITFEGALPLACGERDWWLALLDAPHYAYEMFATYFRAAGGRFQGRLAEGRAPAGAAPFAVLESPPLYDVVRDVNKRSNNVMARQVFLTLAAEAAPPPATPAKAFDVVRRVLALRKVDLPRLAMENGSGLSRRERVTARGLVRLLVAADRSAVREDFASSLAVAAVDGTVEHRFEAGPAAGQALLKTGTLEGVRAIAGYVLDAQGRRFAIAAIVNDRAAARSGPAFEQLVQWVHASAATWDPALQRH